MAGNVSDILKGYLHKTVTRLVEADFFNRVVQFDEDPGNVASSDATFIFAGPPVLNPEKGWANEVIKTTGGAIVDPGGAGIYQFLRPIGAVQQFSLQQGRQVIPFTELGSRLKRQVVGSGQYSANLARVLSRSTNLKASLYSWLPKFMKLKQPSMSPELALAVTPSVVMDKKGRYWEHFQWIGMESEIFNLPFGLLCITGTAGGNFVHAEYLERCYMPNYSKGVSAGSAMIVENASIMVTRPVAFTTLNNDSLIPTELLLKKSASDTFALEEFTTVAPVG
jgi:hypothetical protein